MLDSNNNNNDKKQQQQQQEERRNRLKIYGENALAETFLSIVDRHFHELMQRENNNQQMAGALTTTPANVNGSGGSSSSSNSTLSTKEWLTKQEKKAMSYSTYRNTVGGVVAAVISFGIMIRGRRWIQTFRGTTTTTTRTATGSSSSSSSSSSMPPPPKGSYSNLDRIGGKRENLSLKQQLQQQQASGSITSSKKKRKMITELFPPSSSNNNSNNNSIYSLAETYKQMEWIMAAGIAICIGVYTSWAFADHNGFHRNVARLPMQPGHSHLCQRICPQILTLYQKMATEDQTGGGGGGGTTTARNMNNNNDNDTAGIHVSHQVTTTTTKKSYGWVQHVRATPEGHAGGDALLENLLTSVESVPSDQELWQNPQTPILQSVILLVNNCKERQLFVKELEQQQRWKQQQQQEEKQSQVEEEDEDEIGNKDKKKKKTSNEPMRWWKFW